MLAGDAGQDRHPEQQEDPEERTHQVGLHRRLGPAGGPHHPDEPVERDAREQEGDRQDEQVPGPREHDGARRREEDQRVGLALADRAGELVTGEAEDEQRPQPGGDPGDPGGGVDGIRPLEGGLRGPGQRDRRSHDARDERDRARRPG